MEYTTIISSRQWLHRSTQLLAFRTALVCALVGTLAALVSCGGSSSTTTPLTVGSGSTSDGGGETVPPSAGPETGPPKKIVTIAGSSKALIALFPDGRAYYS